ncbi:hypothetical protein KAI32_04135, partial [Candidatus Pacearchaeota archaeon]|nr:hypothetical protein [Candidatus Pacearchaeota archaeon]
LTKKVGLHRSRVYESLERLMQKGLVHFTIVNKVKKFQAKKPEILLKLIEERKKNIEKLIPSLQQLQIDQETEQTIEAYSGIGGVKSLLSETLDFQKFNVFGAPKLSIDIMNETYWKNYNVKANNKKIKTKMIFNDELRNWSKKISKINKEAEIKFLHKRFDNITETFVSEKSVIIIVWTYQPIGFIIRDSSVAKAYNQYFKILWNEAKK